MGPDEAAAILRLPTTASIEEIDRAYRRQARVSHPDLLGEQSIDDRAAAEAQFVRITEARRVLGKQARDARPASSGASSSTSRSPSPGSSAPFDSATLPSETRYAYGPSSIYGDDGARPVPSTWLFVTWTGVLIIACALSFTGGALSQEPLDLIFRLLPLVACSTSYALTGRPIFFRLVLLLMAATVVITFLFASFGSLLALLFTVVSVTGLMLVGRRAEYLRRYLQQHSDR